MNQPADVPARRPARVARGLAAGAIACALAMPALAVPGLESVRFATFNASMNRNTDTQLQGALASGADAQVRRVAEVIQTVRPDVLLINEFDNAPGNGAGFIAPGSPASGSNAQLFIDNYLGVSQNGAAAIGYDYAYWAPSNTGVPSGFDLNNNGVVGGGDDAYGFGGFPGQFGMLVLSKHAIDFGNVRTMQNFLWKDMPGALLPDDPGSAAPQDWYSPAELDVFRLSSKSHWDVPVTVGGETVHFVTAHPTPPVFDGVEDRNGLRNHDEIRLLSDYVSGASYVYDDNGGSGGLAPGSLFVIAGDLNADPFDGDSSGNPIDILTDNPLINACAVPEAGCLIPASAGGTADTAADGGFSLSHVGDPAYDTADFGFTGVGSPDGSPGNLRVDYVLPSSDAVVTANGTYLAMTDGGVFWLAPATGIPDDIALTSFQTSDHHLVWVDLQLTPVPLPAALPLLASALGALGWCRHRTRRA
ncbi:MAG: endonuclease/exonuclease/phosphatase family protein [Gammaproteobacteria bacterium]